MCEQRGRHKEEEEAGGCWSACNTPLLAFDIARLPPNM